MRHNIIAPRNIIKFAVAKQIAEVGASFYTPLATTAVCGVITLTKRKEELKTWCNSVSLWVMDEAHHVLKANVWGKAVAMFPNAKGLGVTATGERADGKGLGRGSHGWFDTIVEGVSMSTLIREGYLTKYRIYGIDCKIDLDPVEVSKTTGDYKHKQLVQQVRRSEIHGDIVKHYLRLAPGKLGITFVTDVETANKVAEEFRKAGVTAEAVSAKTDDRVRQEIIRRFERREIMMLVNVDLFGEGFNLPAIEVVIFARPTKSFTVYAQQFGRVLRFVEGKLYGLIIDHVGNTINPAFGLPDFPRRYSLLPRNENQSSSKVVALVRYCPECTAAYERYKSKCPFCGHVVQPARRDDPIYVDGDLVQLDPLVLAELYAAKHKIDMDPAKFEQSLRAQGSHQDKARFRANNLRRQQAAQSHLRELMAWWCGTQVKKGLSKSEYQKLFFLRYKIDAISAQGLKKKEALELSEQINIDLAEGTGWRMSA